jgi:protoporphyrinogen/coproporphyrinogen III oxidase
MAGTRLAVVGGGVAGLAGARAALAAAEAVGMDLAVTVFEKEDRLGGKVRTEHVGGVPLEWGPDAFLAEKPRTRELAGELGLGADLVPTGPLADRAYLRVDGRLRRLPRGLVMGVPTGPGALLGAVTSGILGPGAALRAALEPLLPRERSRDRPASEVARRRLGRRAADRLVGPLVEGVYGAPAGEVSFDAGFPSFRGRRSLVLAMARRRRPDGPAFLSLRGGMGRLTARLADDLSAHGATLRTGCRVAGLAAAEGRFAILTPDGVEEADAVLLATPAPAASRLLRQASPGAAYALGWIRYRPSAVVLLRFRNGTLGQPLDGSGFLVAPGEGLAVTACTWLTAKWPHLVPEGGRSGGVWLRAVVTRLAALGLSDAELRDRVEREVRQVMRGSTGAEAVRLHRWDEALPVYAPQHRRRVAAAERALPPRVGLAGASYRGVGLPDCIAGGEEAGRGLVAALLERPG